MNEQEMKSFANINNLTIIKYKGRPSKRLKAGDEMNNNTKGRRCDISK
ncbi:5607_t:CDS:2 [Funneliformis geosporum]|nr:5607_t:CDS:2 [Funneliformis geosporum]